MNHADRVKIEHTEFDRRIKLSQEDKKEIEKCFKDGMSIRAIQRKFKVDRRLIQFVLFPERQKRNVEMRQKRGGSSVYYNKTYQAKKIKATRDYKKRLLEEGKVLLNPKKLRS